MVIVRRTEKAREQMREEQRKKRDAEEKEKEILRRKKEEELERKKKEELERKKKQEAEEAEKLRQREEAMLEKKREREKQLHEKKRLENERLEKMKVGSGNVSGPVKDLLPKPTMLIQPKATEDLLQNPPTQTNPTHQLQSNPTYQLHSNPTNTPQSNPIHAPPFQQLPIDKKNSGSIAKNHPKLGRISGTMEKNGVPKKLSRDSKPVWKIFSSFFFYKFFEPFRKASTERL